MPRALVLFAHPCEESFAAALHGAVVEGLAAGGWEVDDCDLYAEGFNPVLSASERRNYHNLAENTLPVADYVARLRAAEALVLCFPVWNFGPPAILKGWLDRVLLPGVSFKMVDGVVRPNLTHIRKIAAVTTYGGTRLKAFLAGNPPRRYVMRSMRYMTQSKAPEYLALYDMNRATQEKRARHLAHVRREMEHF